ncbi:hypothetical protein EDD37DRAFT_225294 [Exophiala viscosa]|uniref:uncharacterized protein n=1 Tax=Exophiala viscosa TaxID=2486360 RepID=UPI002192BBF8|nr:hypothetical protein EDD37DRAFT_225294 [Exophiala viscosa]
MANDPSDPEADALRSLALLETRLRRLEFLLTGTSDDYGRPIPVTRSLHNSETVLGKLDALQADLARLNKVSGPAGPLLKDIERLATTYPDLFDPSTANPDIPKSEDLSTLASIVLSHATVFPETASRLASLQTLQIPPAKQSSLLATLSPKLEECRATEDSIANEARELRDRSARCLEWWVKIGVIGMGDVSKDWERRVGEVQKHLIRWERRAKEEQGYL